MCTAQSSTSLPDTRSTICYVRGELPGGELHQSSQILSAKSAFPTQSLISFLFSSLVPHIYLPTPSGHLRISKPIWHHLHHRRPFKFASVEWLWQAITPMQDIGNLMRIRCDKSGYSEGGVPWEGGGGQRGCEELARSSTRENTRINAAVRRQRTVPESQIHANIGQICHNTQVESS